MCPLCSLCFTVFLVFFVFDYFPCSLCSLYSLCFLQNLVFRFSGALLEPGFQVFWYSTGNKVFEFSFWHLTRARCLGFLVLGFQVLLEPSLWGFGTLLVLEPGFRFFWYSTTARFSGTRFSGFNTRTRFSGFLVLY